MIKHTMNDHSWFFFIPHKNFRFSILPGPRWPMVALAALAPSPSSGGEKQRPAAAWERWLFNPSGFLAKKSAMCPAKYMIFWLVIAAKCGDFLELCSAENQPTWVGHFIGKVMTIHCWLVVSNIWDVIRKPLTNWSPSFFFRGVRLKPPARI